jgi:hypothetical protein
MKKSTGISHVAMLYVLKGNVFISVGLGRMANASAAFDQGKSIAKKILAHL